MSQFNLETPSITPATTSGTDLAADLSSWRTALHTSHSGTSAPSYAAAGMLWYDTTNDQLKFYDGANHIVVSVVDETNNRAYPLWQAPRMNFAGVTAGTQPTYTLTLAPALTAYTDGDVITAEIHSTNSGAATLNVNGVGAKAIRKIVSGADVAVNNSDLVSGGRYVFNYDSAANSAAGAWILINPRTIRIQSTIAATATSTDHAFEVGNIASGATLRMDGDTIQSSLLGASAGDLNLNTGGADVNICQSGHITTVNSQLNVGEAFRIVRGNDLTIATGAITVFQTSHVRVDTQAAAATDDLDTINGGVDGMMLIIRPVSSARTIVVKHNTGNIFLHGGADKSLTDLGTGILLFYNGATWMGNL